MRIVPVGLTYQQKHRFRSRVLIQVGQPIVVPSAGDATGDAEIEWVRALTEKVADAMRDVTMNLQSWSDLALVETGEQLYALRIGEKERDPDRQRRFARGIEILSREDPELLEQLREDVMSFRTRLAMVAADPKDLSLQYRRPEVARFVLRNLASIFFGLPLFALGLVCFSIPFMAVRLLSRAVKLSTDRIATLKFVASLILTPIWWALMCGVGWWLWGTGGARARPSSALPRRCSRATSWSAGARGAARCLHVPDARQPIALEGAAAGRRRTARDADRKGGGRAQAADDDGEGRSRLNSRVAGSSTSPPMATGTALMRIAVPRLE